MSRYLCYVCEDSGVLEIPMQVTIGDGWEMEYFERPCPHCRPRPRSPKRRIDQLREAFALQVPTPRVNYNREVFLLRDYLRDLKLRREREGVK